MLFPFLAAVPLLVLPGLEVNDPGRLAKTYVKCVEDLNKGHARKPKHAREEDLAARLPKKAKTALGKLLKEKKADDETLGAMKEAAEAALELARVEDFEAVTARMAELQPGSEAELGVALAREEFLLRGLGGLDVAYLEHFATILEAILEAYDETFGFTEWNKVPGKKFRVNVHLVDKITRPPHFAPQYAYHSAIEFPVVDAEALRSPTQDGKFLFYGLCHELGHLIAMWGRPDFEEDHHAWAHYTGVAIVEAMGQKQEWKEMLGELRDERWRSLSKVRAEHAEIAPGVGDRGAVLSLLVKLHDEFGPRALGAAMNWADERDERLRVNHVRYYSFEEFREALGKTLPKKEGRRLAEVWP